MSKVERPPVFSVVVPCFNAATTVAAALDSILAQTVTDLEIIVVDDGSDDGSTEIIAAVAAKDTRITVIRQENAGVSAARNAGILASSARRVAFMDADDLWTKDHLELHLFRFEVSPELGVSFSTALYIDQDGNPCGEARPKLVGIAPVDLLSSNPTSTCSSVVVRREVFRDVGLFRTEMRHNEDQEWLFRVTLSGWVIAGVPEKTVSYRTSPQGLASDLEGMRRGFDTMIHEARKLAPQLVARHEALASARSFRFLARRALRLGHAPKIARGYMMMALRTSPWLLIWEPRATLATLAAALVPALMAFYPIPTTPVRA